MLNIISPDVTGIALSIEISPLAQELCDNSPTFDELPKVVNCVDELLNLDHSVTDVDGDQTSYTFCDPLAAGGASWITGVNDNSCEGIIPWPTNCPPPYDPVNWAIIHGFNATTPLGSAVTINSTSGKILGELVFAGSYVYGVCATTFRDGNEISKVRREFTINIISPTTSSKDIVDDEKLTVYPNPAMTNITITSFDWDQTFNIIDTRGKVVQIGQGKYANIENLAAGVYVVRTMVDGETVVFCVER